MNAPERLQPLILVVDDDPAVLAEVTALLSAAGFACQGHRTSKSAVAAAESLQPDLILSDVALPETSGVEMCRRIQQNPALAGVPVMFLSAGQIPDIIHRSNGVHGAYFLRKPPDAGVLIELIGRALQQAGAAPRQRWPAAAQEKGAAAPSPLLSTR
jgi:CheY-like chemotaxis protein